MSKVRKIPFFPELEAIMAKQGYSQKMLGEEIGLPPGAMYKRMRGEIPFDVNEAIKICDVLNVTFEQIFR